MCHLCDMSPVSGLSTNLQEASIPCNALFLTFLDTMFSSLRARPAFLLRRAQNLPLRIANSNLVLMGVRHHTPDSYSKEVDHTPPSDAKVHRVDPESDRVQKPYEAPSGWSRAGVKTDEYRTDVLKGGKSTTSWL